MNVDNTEKLKHLSLCAGYGGIDLGLKRAIRNIRTICYVEIEYFAIENLVSKIEAGLLDVAPIWSDLKTLDWSLFSERVDIISGGFPCQPFSTAGQKKGDKDPRHLWPHIKRGITICRPSLVLLENVEGILSSKLQGDHWGDVESTPVLLHILREMERMDYRATAGVFSASEVGAPHQRKRVFILGVSNDLKQSGYNFINDFIESRPRFSNAWPANRGQKQYTFEPKRTILGNADGKNGCGKKFKGSTKKGKIKKNFKFTRSSRFRRIEIMGIAQLRRSKKLQKKTKPSLGRDAYGVTYRMDDAELYKSVDNRVNELRLLGNGVIPATAERAFINLFKELFEKYER